LHRPRLSAIIRSLRSPILILIAAPFSPRLSRYTYLTIMELTLIQDYAIQARVAAVIGAAVFDRVFAGVRFAETDGLLLYVYAKDESAAAEIEDDFSSLIADIASRLLNREIELVVVLPKVLQ
jgi:hypothetical protein